MNVFLKLMKIEKTNMRNILIFIDNDVCFRHFIMNSTFKDVCLNNNVKFVFPEENNKRIDNIVFEKKYFNSEVVRLHQDKTRVRTWKYLLYINQLRWRFGRQNKIIRKQRKFNLGWKAYYLFKCMGLPIIWNVYKFFKLKFIITNKYQDLERLIIEFKPDIFIHPSTLDSLYINDLIYYGKKKYLYLGDIKAKIDWGYAKEYVEASWKIMQQKKPEFFVIGTGEIHSVEYFVKHCFLHVDLNYKKYIKIDKNLLRKGKTNILSADTSKAKKTFNFKIKTNLKKLIQIMMTEELKKYNG